MNGQIWATNNADNVGSTFYFYLPLASNEDSDDPTGVPAPFKTKRRFSAEGTFRGENLEKSAFDLSVLLVDDTLINRKVFARMLQKIGITNSVTVESGYEALDELSRNHYDLVITDLQMPGMSGDELSAAIQRTIEAKPGVIGLTADTRSGVAQKCKDSGMADVLYKPITAAEMKEYFESTVPNLRPGTLREKYPDVDSYSNSPASTSLCHTDGSYYEQNTNAVQNRSNKNEPITGEQTAGQTAGERPSPLFSLESPCMAEDSEPQIQKVESPLFSLDAQRASPVVAGMLPRKRSFRQITDTDPSCRAA